MIDYQAHKEAIELLYEGRCTISEYQTKAGALDGFEGGGWKDTYTNIPCHLAFERLPVIGDGDVPDPTQGVTLVLANDIIVATGSKITVTQFGRTEAYKRAGKPAVLGSHQEIPLELV